MDALTKLNDDFLSCSICTDIFKDPCTIGCYHTFCRECLMKFTKTRCDAISAKSILCPSCRQMTKVPRPQEPVEQWCQQFKPSFLIQGLLDTFTSEQGESQVTEPVKHCCFTCQQIGKTSPATSVCQDCDVILCETCARMHTVTPMQSTHVITTLTDDTKPLKKRKVMCQEHNSLVEFCCKDCQKAVCNKCCIIYHRKCHSVVTIDSMIPEIKEVLLQNQDKINSQLMGIRKYIEKQRSQVEKSGHEKVSLQSEIRRVSQEAVDLIRQKEKKLLDELDKLTEEQTGQLEGQIKSGEIEQQTYQQYSEFIKQVLQSESPMDLYEMYMMCQSGEITRELKRNQTGDIKVKSIVFKKEFDVNQMSTSLHLGHLSVLDDDFYQDCTATLLSTVNINSADDDEIPDPNDVELLNIDGTETLVVTDFKNESVKSSYIKEGQTHCKSLKLIYKPHCVTKLGGDKVAVSYFLHNNFKLIQVTPDPVHLSTIQTQKRYRCLTALSDQTLAAGCGNPPSIDILDLSGKVLRFVITPSTGQQLIQDPWYMCTTRQGHIVVTDFGTKSVFCVTQQGEVVFTYKLTREPGGCGGVTTADTGSVAVAIIQLTETGRYVRDLLTLREGIQKPQGIYLHLNKLYVTGKKGDIKVFQLASQ